MERPSITVLQSFPSPRPTTNPYVVQLMQSLPSDVRILTFSWRNALLRRWDVFHVHWPEILVRGRTRWHTYVRQLLTMLLLIRIRVTRRGLVRTIHNRGPHEQPGWIASGLLGLFDRWTTETINLTRTTTGFLDRPGTVVPHGDYRGWFVAHPQPETVPGRLLFFGLIRPYKQVIALVRAFGDANLPDLTLRVVGQPQSSELRQEIESAASVDPRVTLSLGHASDEELAAEIGSAELVILPYREMINSGAALLALSLNRPVWVPQSETTRELADEVGPGWVLLADGVLDGEAVEDAVRLCRSCSASRSAQPDLSRRDWAEIGRLHAAVYQSARRRSRGGRRSANSDGL